MTNLGSMKLTVFAALLLALGAPACAATGSDTGPGPTIEPQEQPPKLVLLGPAAVTLMERGELLLRVRYEQADGTPISGGIVDYAINGDPNGGSLSGYAATTGNDGIAEINVRAGNVAEFAVDATAPGVADPATWGVSVTAARFGTFDYVVQYMGRRDVRSAETAIFANMTCAALARAIPAPRESHTTRIAESKRVDNVEVGLRVAVYALGIDTHDMVAATGCSDITLTGPTGHVDVVLSDEAEIIGGTYNTEEHLDVTAGFSSTLDTLFAAMRGLSEDPARFLVDFVATYSGTPDWLRSAISSGAIRSVVAGLLRDAISRIHVPSYVTDVLDVGAEFDRGLSGMTLAGTMTFGEPDEFGATRGRHVVTAVRMPLLASTVERPVRAEADIDVSMTMSTGFSVAEHDLAISFGQLAEMLLDDVLLPALPGAPHSMRELLASFFDCRAIASSIGGEDPTLVSITNAACEIGEVALGEAITNYITALWQYDTLHIAETAQLVDSDYDYDRDRFNMGHVAARWTGASGEMSFPGTLTGSRRDDTVRTNPIRQHIIDLR